MKKLYLVVFIYLLAISSIFSCSAEQLTLTIPTASWAGNAINSDFTRSVDTPVPPDGYILAGVSASNFWSYTNCIAYYVPSDNLSWSCRGTVNSSGIITDLDNFSASSGTIMFSLRKKADGTWDNFTSHANYNVGGFGAIWCKLPLVVSNGSTLSPSTIYPDDLFSMRSISTSEKQSLVEVVYNGTTTDSYSVGFYACTSDDYSSWWGSSTADLASQSFSDLPSLGDDGSSPWYNNLFPPIKKTTRITPTNNSFSRKKSIQTLPSPRVVIGYDSVSQILPAEAVVDWQDWINNSDMGGVYASTNIVIVARISYTHTDPLTGNALTDYYFCSQQFDLSSIISSAFTPDEMNTKTQPYVAPSDVSDLDKLATYIRYLEVNNNTNANIRYNNFIQHLDESAPLYVLQGLNAFLPSLSFELDSLFDSFSIDLSVPSPADISNLQNEINLSQAAFIEKFAWTAVITSEVDFVTSTVVAAGDSPPVFSANVVYNSPSSDQQIDYGNVVFFDATDISPAFRTKVKKVITVFCSLGLLFFIYKTLPATIGRIPEK